MSTLNYLDSFYTFPSIYTHFSINIKTFCFHGDLYLFLFFFKEPLISFFKIFSLWEYKRELYDPYLICKRIKVPMDYDARKDSLLSEQESEKVEIYLSCRNVQASPLTCEIHLQEGNKPRKGVYSSKPTQTHHGRADFANSLIIEYFFEYRQKLSIEIFDVSGQGRYTIGRVQTTVGEIFNGRDKGIVKEIDNNGQITGEMLLRCEMVERGCQRYVQFDMVTRNLDVGSAFLCFGEGEASWKLYKIKNKQEYLLNESEVKPGKNNRYQHFKINQKRLCNNNPKQPIILRFFNDHHMIGEVYFDLATLQEGKHRFTLVKKGSEKGIAIFENYKESVKYDFTDYLSSGMQMAMVVCIDFTASNGIQTASSSLHYHNVNKRSQYEEALHEVCAIVLDYDTDKLVPCFGFGAKVNMPSFNTYNKVHHCFPLNGSQTNPNLFQLAGIEEGYRKCLPHLQFSGPTYFAPLLREAMEVCKNMKREQKEYMILLILTDGVIHDKEEVKDLLVKCGKLPLSIIMIGIGNGDDWSAMHELDDDDMQMTDFQGNKTIRDLVQFVEFQKHNNNGVELASQVLYELPRQVQEYHQLCGLTPEVYRKNMDVDSMMQKNRMM